MRESDMNDEPTAGTSSSSRQPDGKEWPDAQEHRPEQANPPPNPFAIPPQDAGGDPMPLPPQEPGEGAHQDPAPTSAAEADASQTHAADPIQAGDDANGHNPIGHDTPMIVASAIPPHIPQGLPQSSENAETGEDDPNIPDALAKARERRRAEGAVSNFPTPEEVYHVEGDLPETPSPALAPSPAVIPHKPASAAATMGEAVLHLRAAQGAIDQFAAQIKMGEYGENGAGDAGRIWRAIATAPQNEGVEIWGEIMALGTGLWSKGYGPESVTFVERSAQDFTIPPSWEERVNDAIKTGKDYQAVLAAEQAFDNGNDEEALTHANNITSQEESAQYREDLNLRSKRRARNRRLIFASAGVSVAGLLVASIIAISTLDNLNVVPPTPNFSGVGDAIENMSEDLRDQRQARDLAGGQPTSDPLAEVLDTPSAQPQAPLADAVQALDNTTPQPPAADAVVAISPPLSTPQAVEDAAVPLDQVLQTPAPEPQQETVVEQAPPTTATPLQEGANTTPVQADTTAPSTQQPAPQEIQAAPQTQAAASADEGMVSSCILGYAVMAQAESMAQGQGAQVAGRLASFSGTIDAACTPLEIAPTAIARGMGALDQAEVAEMARNILLGQQ